MHLREWPLGVSAYGRFKLHGNGGYELIEESSFSERITGCILGTAVGDALGMPFEGVSASSLKRAVTNLDGFKGAPWRMLKAGQWTDDTALMICMAESLSEKTYFDLDDVSKRFSAWFSEKKWRGIDEEKYIALRALSENSPAFRNESTSLGSGAITMLPPLCALSCLGKISVETAVKRINSLFAESDLRLERDLIYGELIARAIQKELSPEELLENAGDLCSQSDLRKSISLAQKLLESGCACDEALVRIRSVSHISYFLIGPLFCIQYSEKEFMKSVSCAISGGLETDVTAAVAGSIFGAIYGIGRIPENLISELESSGRIVKLAENMANLA